MKKILLSLGVIVLTIPGFSQLLSWSPAFQTESSTTAFQITMSPNFGNKALLAYTPTSDVYVHIGVITNLSTSNSDWKYVQPANFNLPVPALSASFIANSPSPVDDQWRFTINGGLRTYFNVTDPAEHILKIAILFRNGNGSKVQRNAGNVDNGNMYIPINDGTLDTRFTTPFFQPLFNPIPENISLSAGSSISLTAVASASSDMRLLFDGSPVAMQTGVTTISGTQSSLTAGSHTVTVEAVSGITKTSSFNFFIPGPNTIEALPAGVKQGINYEADQTAATLVLYAPNKTRVSVIGDLPASNWEEQLAYQMKKTPDGNYYWLRITGLTPGTEYSFQYLVDGNLRIGEAYTEKVLDPWNDSYISSTTYPSLKPYPAGLTSGVVSILQTAAPVYNWQTTTFTRPDKRNLMIYELLLRDFLDRHDWTGMTDTLNYLKKLGINTIELMPVNEFEGNNSWGYNPDYYFAPDKYYGPKNDLKRFVDMAHSKGIAVVMDIALNHSFGLSPMVQLYWDAANNRPAANNPWFNAVPKHAFNVGYDMNHGTAATNYFFSRVVEHWLTEYKMDGFRFDLSKGFTQNQTCDGSGGNCDVNAWSNYDASRIAIWKKYYDTLQLKAPGSYTILEHFADNAEEIELSNYGMLLWGNVNYNFSEAAMGWVSNSNFDAALHISRGWSQPNLVSYMESHDEERMMYRNINFGNETNPAHNTRTLPVALGRMGMNAAFLLTMPGPKMIWEFGELGYDYSIDYCISTGTIGDCRVDPKPILWNYLQDANRKALHDVYANLLKLRSNPLFAETFTTGVINRNLSGAFKWMTLNSAAGKLVVIGNFDVTAQTGSVTFPAGGTWYNYLNPPATFAATGGSQSFTLQPGEYRIYLNSLVVLPVTLINFNGRNDGTGNLLTWVVENETNVSRYELQRSENGRDFYSISTTNATGSRNYNYTDADIQKPVYFYRLKSIDLDGSYTYSSVIKLSGPVKNMSLAATPNPFGNVMKLTIASPVKEPATVVLTDLSGKILLQKNVILLQGVNTIEIEKLHSLAAGTYILNLVSAQNKTSTRVIKSLK
jgi:glycosidase